MALVVLVGLVRPRRAQVTAAVRMVLLHQFITFLFLEVGLGRVINPVAVATSEMATMAHLVAVAHPKLLAEVRVVLGFQAWETLEEMGHRIITLAEEEEALELPVQTPQQTRVATVVMESQTLLLEALSPTVEAEVAEPKRLTLTCLEPAEPEGAETVLQELGLLVAMGLMASEEAEEVQGELVEPRARMAALVVPVLLS